jgi:SRSO17 transposase
MWADEGVYWLVDFEPYTPSHHFRGGKSAPAFRTKLKMASELVENAVGRGIPFRAVVADTFYGEDRGFKRSLQELGVAYMLSLKKSPSWWHAQGTIGALWEAALAAGWGGDGELGRRWCAPSGTGTGRIGGRWKWRPVPTAPSGRRG